MPYESCLAANPLSFNQESCLIGRWLANVRKSSSTRPYNVYLGLRLEGPVNVKGLDAAINRIVQRHDTLRTAFTGWKKTASENEVKAILSRASDGSGAGKTDVSIFETGLFGQFVAPHARIEIQVRLALGDSRISKVSNAVDIARNEVECWFDYESPPLIRATLVRIDALEHLLVIVMPHLVCDGISLAVIMDELKQNYELWAAGKELIVTECPFQYTDFARLQRSHLVGETLTQLHSYWRNQWLDFESGFVTVEDLGALKPLQAIKDFTQNEIEIILNPSTSEKLRDFSREYKFSQYMVALGATFIALSKATGKLNIGIWGYFANRFDPATRGLIGWFSNSHILGGNVEPDSSCLNMLRRVKESSLQRLRHQEMPLPLLTNSLVSGRSGGRPVPGVYFDVFYQRSDVTLWAGNLRVEMTDLLLGRNPLSIALLQFGRAVTIRAKYSPEIFSKKTVFTLLTKIHGVIESIVRDPTAQVSQVRN